MILEQYLNSLLLLSEDGAVVMSGAAVQMEDTVTLTTQVAAALLTQDHGKCLPIIMVFTCWLCGNDDRSMLTVTAKLFTF